MIACEDIQYCKNLDVQIKLPKKLERSVRYQDKDKNLEVIGDSIIYPLIMKKMGYMEMHFYSHMNIYIKKFHLSI